MAQLAIVPNLAWSFEEGRPFQHRPAFSIFLLKLALRLHCPESDLSTRHGVFATRPKFVMIPTRDMQSGFRG